MFIRIFTSISLVLLLGACQSTSSQSETAPSANTAKNSEVKSGTKQSSPVKGAFQAWPNDEDAISYLEAYDAANPEKVFTIQTSFGAIKVRLYDNTPLHRANMVYLIKEHQYFNGTWFHRVSKDHVIQAGNNDEYTLKNLRDKIGKYELPPEAIGRNYHKYGSVAMARSYHDNPEKRSDPFEFYINLGQKYSNAQLDLMEKEYGIVLNAEQRQLYSSLGGSPHLDQEHTVIGEVIEGLQVVEAIAKVETDRGEWPLENIPIKIFF